MARVYQVTSFDQIFGIIEKEVADIDQTFRRTSYAPAFQSFSKDLESAHATYFQQKRTPDGEAWKPNGWRTVAWKGHGRQLEGKTGRLMQSVADETGDSIRQYGSHLMKWGTNLDYAALQYWGGWSIHPYDNRPVKIPPRHFLGFDGHTIDQAVEKVADHAVNALRDDNGGGAAGAVAAAR